MIRSCIWRYSMFGLNKWEIQRTIEFSALSLTTSPELKNIAGQIAEGVAKAMEENNKKMTTQIKDEIRRKIR